MANFGVTPTWVYPVEEKYNVVTTPSENMKKEYYLLSSTPNRQFRLLFSGVTDEAFPGILNHWGGVSGTFGAFYWTSVPSYINGGAGSGVSMLGRWVGKPNWTPKARHWEVDIIFEKDI